MNDFSQEQLLHDKYLDLLILWLENHRCVVTRTGYEYKYRDDPVTLVNLQTVYDYLGVQKEKSLPDIHTVLPNGKRFNIEYKNGYTLEAFQCSYMINTNDNIYVIRENGKEKVWKPNINDLYPQINYHDYAPWLNDEGLPYNHEFLTEMLKIDNFVKKERNFGNGRSNDPYVWLKNNTQFYEFETWFYNTIFLI